MIGIPTPRRPHQDHAVHVRDVAALEEQLSAATARVADLERQLAEALAQLEHVRLSLACERLRRRDEDRSPVSDSETAQRRSPA